jgi:1-acyl-sn-glycerol-3-phosphate acyltransferase
VPAIYDLSRALVRVTGSLAWRVRVTGAHHIPRQGGVLVASNHQSFLDVFLVGTAMRRRTHFMARATLWDNALLGAWMTAVGALPVSLGRPRKDELQRVIERLRAGKIVTLFPEGTRTTDGSIGSMRGGLGMLARRSAVPVVPVLVQGAFEAWPRERRLPRRGRVTIRFGRPVAYPDDWDDDEVAADLRRRLIALQEVSRQATAADVSHGGGRVV